MAIVCSFIRLHQITEQNTPTNKTGTQNQHFACQLNMSSMCPPVVALRSHSRRRCHSPTLLTMMVWYGIVEFNVPLDTVISETTLDDERLR